MPMIGSVADTGGYVAQAAIALVSTLVGAGIGAWATWRTTDRMLAEDRRRRQREAEQRQEDAARERQETLVRLLVGLQAEVQENIDARPWDAEVPAEYVRDMWIRTKESVGWLPDEVLDSLRLAYAHAARYNGAVAWARAVQGLSGRYDEVVRAAGEEANEHFVAAKDVLDHWLRQLEPGEVLSPPQAVEIGGSE